MQIQSINLSELKPAKYNPRKDLQPEDSEYQKLKKSILEFDLVEPIVWNKKTGNVIGGHQRLKILQELGKEKTQVVVVDLPQAREAALNIALNKISGEWDYPKLKDIISEIDTGDFDIEITGFDSDELENIFGYEVQKAQDEWQDMPEFQQDNEMPYRQIIVSFKNEKDVNKFSKAINQTLTDKTKSVWFPSVARNNDKNLRYSNSEK